MIKVYRKIRQRLLTENNVSKYLLYAIGEIVLIVIGILIALQINNWNEYQKAVKSENELLTSLQIEIISGKTISVDFFKGLKYWKKLTGEKEAYLVYDGTEKQSRSDGITVLPLNGIAKFQL